MDELVLGSFHRLLDVAVTISTLARFLKGMTTEEAIVYLVSDFNLGEPCVFRV